MVEQQKSKTLGIVSIVFGAISIIPLIGFFTGAIAVILGIIDIKKNKSSLGIIGLGLGILGILVTVGTYGSLYYFGFVQRDGMYDDLRSKMVSEQHLPNTINAIEAYKARFGEYPDSIEDIKQISNDPFVIMDQTQMVINRFKTGSTEVYFYYQNNGDTYFLFSKGIDGRPFTEDDIYPTLSGDRGEIGYREP